NGCLLYSIPCAHFCVCCCCGGGRACMKWCALNMKEGQRRLNCFCDEYWLRFPWTNNPRGVRGFSFLLLCCCAALCAALSCVCVCVPSVRGAGTTDRSRRVCACGGALCAAPVCFSLLHLCVGVAAGLCVCVCLLPWIGVCVVRRTVHAWLLPSPHVFVCPLCVSAAPLVSPVALHVPHFEYQLQTTERPHSR
ncbi:mucin TcMUCII, partial [Trypanosoma cruzi]